MSLTHSLRREAEPYAKQLERLSRSSKCTDSSLNVRDRPAPNNPLANALNQTFQFNSTSATSRVPTTPRTFLDATPPVSNAVANSTVKPQHRDVGVQKSINFTRNSSTALPSGDASSCIVRLEAENRELRNRAEVYKRECEGYRESLDEIHRRYSSSRSHHHPLPLTSGPSNLASHSPQELSTHPRWRTRGISDNQFQSMDIQEPDHPPIETLPLPTPSSPESVSPSARRRTPTESRSLKMKARGTPGSQVQPYSRPPQYSRKRDRANARRHGNKPGGPPSLDQGGNVIGSPAPPNSSTATVETEDSSTSPSASAAVAQDHNKANSQG